MEKKTDDIQKEIEISEADALRLRKVCEKHLSRTPCSIENIPAGLGTRRFYRIEFETGAPSRLIARLEANPADAQIVRHYEPEPPQWLQEPALEPVRTFLEEAGLPVPKSAFHDAVAGLDLIEDLGDLFGLGDGMTRAGCRQSATSAKVSFYPSVRHGARGADLRTSMTLWPR